MYRASGIDEYGRIKVGPKQLDDAILAIKNETKTNYTKPLIKKALIDRDIATLRDMSNFFYSTNGLYSRQCNYFAFLFRYDWYIVPEIYNEIGLSNEKVIKEFYKILNFIDRSNIKKFCADVALEVIRNGVYYGYRIQSKDSLQVQQLPAKYCRSRYFKGNRPAVEFNMKYFDDNFSDIRYRLRILKMFPKEFQKGYLLYKEGKLPTDSISETCGSWYLLDPDYAFKFNLNHGDIPIFVNALPYLLDLEGAQELDRRKQMQKLLKILVQELPLDKNGDLIFDSEEALDIHNNAVQMLANIIGVDILTTFAPIKSIDLSDKTATAATDDLERVERALFNALGTSQNLFDTDGNMSLDKSIANDEAIMKDLILQFNTFFNQVISEVSTIKKCHFKFYMLETTIYNYKDISKMYKDQTSMGYSKMLPQVALGHSQAAILNTAYFENDILELSKVMIPPLTSNTVNGEDILGTGKTEEGTAKKTTAVTGSEEKTPGRKELPDDQKSDKTIANRESMS